MANDTDSFNFKTRITGQTGESKFLISANYSFNVIQVAAVIKLQCCLLREEKSNFQQFYCISIKT